jgi:hypothetical protein
MMIGLGLSLAQNQVSIPAFNPLSLFASSEQGAIYDLTNSATVFQEQTGASATTPSGADGPIGTLKDLSPNNNYAMAPDDAGRPTWRSAGYADPDGTTDYLTCDTVSFSGANVYIIAAMRSPASAKDSERLVSLGTTAGAADSNSATRAAGLARFGTSAAWGGYRTGWRSTTALANATTGVFESFFQATSHTTALNGGADTVSSHASLGNFTVTRMRLFDHAVAAPGGTERTPTRLYRMVIINRIPTSGERASLQAWCAAAL